MREQKREKSWAPKNKMNCVVKGRKIESNIKKGTLVMLILYKEASFSLNNLDSPLQSAAISLLKEHEDVFPEEMQLDHHQ